MLLEGLKKVDFCLLNYMEMVKILQDRMAEREASVGGGCIGIGSGVTMNWPSSPVEGQVCHLLSDIERVRIPDRVVDMESIGADGERVVRRKSIRGGVICRPVVWIFLVERLKEIFEGEPEGEVLRLFYFGQRPLDEVAKLMDEKRGRVVNLRDRVRYAALGLAVGDKRCSMIAE